MKIKRETIGFMVFDATEDWEQPLALQTGDGLPELGILEWVGRNQKAAVFPSRRDARKAIDRTEHYRLAFGENYPERKCCKIVPVERIVEVKS